MRKQNLLRIGFYASLTILVFDLVVTFWPYISSFYFLRVAGMLIGITGSIFFGMALAANPPEEEKEEL